MGMVGLDDIVHFGKCLNDSGYNSISPHFIPKILPNMAAGLISLKYGFKVSLFVKQRKSFLTFVLLQ